MSSIVKSFRYDNCVGRLVGGFMGQWLVGWWVNGLMVVRSVVGGLWV